MLDIDEIRDQEQNRGEVRAMTKDELLDNEDALLHGLLEAAASENDDDLQRMIQIKRKDKVLFKFAIRPLREEEIYDLRRACTKTYANPAGRHLPKIEGETNMARLRSLKIYTATTDEYKSKLWDNKEFQRHLNVLSADAMIDTVLLAGEKDAICDQIDDLSGYGSSVSTEEMVKN